MTNLGICKRFSDSIRKQSTRKEMYLEMEVVRN